MAFLKDLLSPGPGTADDFSQEWHDAFGMFESPAAAPAAVAPAGGAAAPAAAPPRPPSPGLSGFLPSQLLDHSLSATGGLKLAVPQSSWKQLKTSVMETLFWHFQVCECGVRVQRSPQVKIAHYDWMIEENTFYN